MGRSECKLGFWVGLYQMRDKSGIWRFYGRIWKNIFYEKGEKESFWVVFGMEREKGKRDRVFGLCMGRDVIWNIP